MKTVVGVDSVAESERILRALRDLNFPQCELHLAHVIEMWADTGGAQFGVPSVSTGMELYFSKLEQAGKETLQELKRAAESEVKGSCRTELLFGGISNQLMDYGDSIHAELLALGSSGKGPIEGVLIGSVGRKAALNAKQSVLIVKGNYAPKQGLSVVIATDHSPYADRWLNKFIQWAPGGLSRICLVSVLPDVQRVDLLPLEFHSSLREYFMQANQSAVKKLKILKAVCEDRIETGPVGDTLARVMQETGADLLVLGSQGHGFWDRVTLGSVSLDQVAHRPYSVLIVRA